jgi:hypothetical protein
MRTLFLLLTFPLFSVALEPCVSGTPVGQRPGPYSFLVASGAQRGQQTCYICETEDRPAVIVFARHLNEPVKKLLLKVDGMVTSQPKDSLRAWMTILGEKVISLDDLAKWSKATGLKNVPVGVFDDPDGPPSYKLNKEAEVTVLLFVKRKVIANFAFRTGELTDDALTQIEKTLPKLIESK